MAGRLQGKAAIVTGGAGGIGATTTGLLFCKEGARVVLVDRDVAAMAEVCAGIRAGVPGAVLLDLVLDTAEESAAGGPREELGAEELESCLLRRWASPREIAYPILWLTSYVTASVLRPMAA